MNKYIVNYVLRRDGLPEVVVSPEVYYGDFKKRIHSMIGVVEQMCYTYEGGKNKADWGQYMQEQFQNFRKKMLDIADEVAGLEKAMVIDEIEADDTQVESFISSLFSKKG